MKMIPEQTYQTILLGTPILPKNPKHIVRISETSKPDYLHQLPYKTEMMVNRDTVYFQWESQWYVAKCLRGT